MKALVIDEPWIGLILSGEKSWEMRKTSCNLRGPIALIRKGSGQIVGTARIVDSLPPLSSAADYAAAEPTHRIPPARQQRARLDGWATPWVLADAKPLTRPVAYRHPSGAVIWVSLDADVAAAVRAKAGLVSPSETPAPTRAIGSPEPAVKPVPAPQSAPGINAAGAPARPGESRTVVVTGGSIRNNHIYLPLDFFPADAIGGSNKSELARKLISVSFEPGQTVMADIDGTKRILRARGRFHGAGGNRGRRYGCHPPPQPLRLFHRQASSRLICGSRSGHAC